MGGRERPAHDDDAQHRSESCSSAAISPGRAAARSSTRCDVCAPAGAEVELDLVTHDQLPPEAGITVHHGLGPNSPALIELYRSADIFCLPTLGDCLPMVLSEAGAAGLPLVSTDVGAIREIVRPEHTGLLVPPGDDVALTAALDRLVADPALRRSLGAQRAAARARRLQRRQERDRASWTCWSTSRRAPLTHASSSRITVGGNATDQRVRAAPNGSRLRRRRRLLPRRSSRHRGWSTRAPIHDPLPIVTGSATDDAGPSPAVAQLVASR